MSAKRRSLPVLARGWPVAAAVIVLLAVTATYPTLAARLRADASTGPLPVPMASGPAPTYPVPPLTGYVVNNGSDSVSVVDAADGSILGTIAVGSGPTGVAINPNGSTIYVTDTDSNAVSVISTSTDLVTDQIPLGAGTAPKGISITPDGSALYVADSGSASVSVISTATDLVTATIPVGLAPGSVVVGPVGAYAFVTNRLSNTVSVISTATNTVVHTIAVGLFPSDVIVNPTGSLAYVTNECGNATATDRYCDHPGTLSVIDLATFTVSASASVGYGPVSVSETPNGETLYVVNSCGPTVPKPKSPPPSLCGTSVGNVTTIDASTLTADFDPTAGYDQPGLYGGSAASADGTIDYVVNSCGQDVTCGSPGTVSVFNTDIGTKVAATVTGLGSDPTTVGFSAPWTAQQSPAAITTAAGPALTYLSPDVWGAEEVAGQVLYQGFDPKDQFFDLSTVPSAATTVRPAVVADGKYLWFAWTTSSSTIEFNELNTTTNQWVFSSPRTVPQLKTTLAPALANVNGDIYVACTGQGSRKRIFYTFWNGTSWASQTTIPSATTSAAPAIAAAAGSSTLYAAWLNGTGTSMDFSSDSGSGFSTPTTVPQAATNRGPALAVTQNGVYLSWWAATTNQVGWLFKSSLGWVPQRFVPAAMTDASPGMTAYGSNIFLAWKGFGNQSYWFSAFE
jgi:YVTN family beta-propeller protein